MKNRLKSETTIGEKSMSLNLSYPAPASTISEQAAVAAVQTPAASGQGPVSVASTGGQYASEWSYSATVSLYKLS
jgi:hypothetical protein